jgi:type IV minor pilin ComP (DNA uptake receptor)
MGRVTAFLGLLIALATGAWLFTQRAQQPDMAGNPRATVDVVGVKNDLISLAQAERRYFARESRYASLDELRSAGDVSMPSNNRGPYTYTVDTSDSGFRITATYTGPAEAQAVPNLIIDESMQIR